MKIERRLFVLLLLLESAVFAWLILSHRLPRGHDTLGLYLQQYVFLAQAVQSHSVALWMPSTAHGLVTNLTAGCQGGLLQNVLLLVGGVPEGTNHLPLFYAGLFVDELILLTGIWCLGRRYYASPYARFFVAAAAIGSSFWMDHLVCNFRITYCLPLLLSLGHDVLETGDRRKFFLAFNLAVLQFTGITPYIPLFTLLVVLVYFIVHAAVFRIPVAGLLRRLRPRPSDAATLLLNLGLLAALFALLSHGASELRLLRPGRNPDGSVALDDFITYGGALNPVRYLDLLLGLSPSLDYTLYCGILTVAFAAVGVFLRPGRTVYQLLICLALVLLFSTGYLSAVSMTAYSLVPPLHFFRYVSLTSPVVKLFLILLSGFGFEALLARREAPGGILIPVSRGMTAAGLLMAMLAGMILWKPDTLADLTGILRTGRLGLGQRPGADRAGHAGALIGASAAAAAAAAFLLRRRARAPEASPLLIAALLALQLVDLYRWKVQMTVRESVPLSADLAALQAIRPVPYIPRRSSGADGSDRARAWKEFDAQGAVYDFTDPYLAIDPTSSRYLVTHWLAPFDRLLRAHERRSFEAELTEVPRLHLRPGDPYATFTGAAADKIQIFRRARFAGSDEEIAGLLNAPDFSGDLLLLNSPQRDGTPVVPSAVGRLEVPVLIQHFDFDALDARVDLPAGESEGWLFYADVWHPGWTATVNDQPAPIERAFLAYKAVKLGPGSNVVRFRFRDPVRSACHRIIGAASLLLLASVGVLLARLLRPSGGP